jgi:hypothetical protein
MARRTGNWSETQTQENKRCRMNDQDQNELNKFTEIMNMLGVKPNSQQELLKLFTNQQKIQKRWAQYFALKKVPE